MSEIYKSSLELHDLCEDVFHIILGYIPRMHVYFSVRNVCKAMRQKVDAFTGFISEVGKFVVATRYKPLKDNLASFVTIFYIIKTKSHPYLMHIKFLPDLPPPAMLTYLKLKTLEEMNERFIRMRESVIYMETFGGIINGKLIMGYYCKQQVLKKVEMESPGLMGKFKHERKIFQESYRLVPYIFVYEEAVNEWNDITPNVTKLLECESNTTCKLSFCVVDKAILVGLFLSSTGRQGKEVWIKGSPTEFRLVRFQFPDINDFHPKYSIQANYSINLFKLPYDIRVKEYPYFSFEWSNQLILNQNYEAILPQGYNYFFFCQVEKQAVALEADQKSSSGMEKPSRLDIFNNEVFNHLLFGGHYLDNSVSFKLKNSLYIASSRQQYVIEDGFRIKWNLRFDRYIIKEDRYHENISVSIPSEIDWISGAVADLNQNYAFLVTNVGLIVFTEENGFECNKSDFIPFFARHAYSFDPCASSVAMFCIG